MQLRRRLFFCAPVVLGLADLGCSSSAKRGFEEQPDAGPSAAASDSDASAGLGQRTDADAPPSGCTAASRLVYVLSTDSVLYSFAPDTVTFTRIGALACNARGGATPNSMSIDRKGTAWINYSDGSIFRVSTKDASCSATNYPTGQQGLTRMGLAFATQGSTENETLYVAANTGALLGGGKGFWKLDTFTMEIAKIGDYSGGLRAQSAELTGTGDGRLFGFFSTSPATWAEVDPATGATTNDKKLDGLRDITAWAFSFWGGDFWFYTSELDRPSKVTRMATSGDGSLSTVKEDVGFRIVGAGVSTCAPTTPPR